LIDFSNFHLGQKENILGLNECIEEAGLLDPSAQKIGYITIIITYEKIGHK